MQMASESKISTKICMNRTSSTWIRLPQSGFAYQIAIQNGKKTRDCITYLVYAVITLGSGVSCTLGHVYHIKY